MTRDIQADFKKNAEQKGVFHDPGRRFPIFTGPKGYADVPYLSKEEKALGVELLWARWNAPNQDPLEFAIQARNPSVLFQCDPLLWQEEMRHYGVVTGLVYGKNYSPESVVDAQEGKFHDQLPGSDSERYKLGQLIVVKIAQLYNIEWVLKLVGVGSTWEFLSKGKIALLDQPKSSVWSEQESLVLEFTTAMVKVTMTDELFERCKKAWGEKQLLRYAKWITVYVGCVMTSMLYVSDADKDGSMDDMAVEL